MSSDVQHYHTSGKVRFKFIILICFDGVRRIISRPLCLPHEGSASFHWYQKETGDSLSYRKVRKMVRLDLLSNTRTWEVVLAHALESDLESLHAGGPAWSTRYSEFGPEGEVLSLVWTASCSYTLLASAGRKLEH